MRKVSLLLVIVMLINCWQLAPVSYGKNSFISHSTPSIQKAKEKTSKKDKDQKKSKKYERNIIREAEAGILLGVDIATNRDGYSGSGYVNGLNDIGDSVMVTVNMQKKEKRDLRLRYAFSDGEEKHISVYINGKKFKRIELVSSYHFEDIIIENMPLKKGFNTISIKRDVLDDSGIELDKLTIYKKGNEYFKEEAYKTVIKTDGDEKSTDLLKKDRNFGKDKNKDKSKEKISKKTVEKSKEVR